MRSALLASAVLLTGCGLYAGGASGDPADGGALDGDAAPVATDAPAQDDAPAPPPPSCGMGTACVSALGAGWTPLAFASTQTSKCPQGWTRQDVIGDAVAGANACECTCGPDPNDPPSCALGMLASQVGQGQCSQGGPTYNVTGTGCSATLLLGVTTLAQMTPLSAHVGKCVASPKPNPTKLTTRDERACVPPDACLDDVCQGISPVGFASCVVHDGDVQCPGAPWTNRTLIGSQAALACGGCAGCASALTCADAILHYYVDPVCAVELATRKVDGNCNGLASGLTGSSLGFKYDVKATPQCTPGSAATTAVDVTGARTVCCR